VKHILGPANRVAVERLACRHMGVVFDYDGTLAPAASPREVEMRPATRHLLEATARIYPCAVISSRPIDDLARHLAGTNVGCLLGSHGGRWAGAAGDVRSRVAAWRRLLGALLEPVRGVVIEDRWYSLSIHYRQARDRRWAERAVLDALGALSGARIVTGRWVFEVLPEGAPDKGAAVVGMRRLFGCDAVLYVGDDATDEDVFAAGLDDPSLLGVRVGLSRFSGAAFYLRDQREVDDLLRLLLAQRHGNHGQPRLH
jgi:trehalose 6-phosphate phosphatase